MPPTAINTGPCTGPDERRILGSRISNSKCADRRDRNNVIVYILNAQCTANNARRNNTRRTIDSRTVAEPPALLSQAVIQHPLKLSMSFDHDQVKYRSQSCYDDKSRPHSKETWQSMFVQQFVDRVDSIYFDETRSDSSAGVRKNNGSIRLRTMAPDRLAGTVLPPHKRAFRGSSI